MIITCQECESSFNIDDSIIKESGSKVKCSKCEHVFVVYPSTLTDEPDTDDAIGGFDQENEDLQFPQEDETDTEDLGLPELDSIFGEEEDASLEEISAETSDELDLDLGDDDEEQDQFAELEEPDDTDLPELEDIMDFDEETDTEALSDDTAGELELDLDEEFGSDDGTELDEFGAEAEETELDLLDTENLLDDDEVSPADDEVDLMADELESDVGLTDMDDEADDLDIELEETDEPDLLDLDDGLELDETPEFEEASEAVADELDLGLDSEDDDAQPVAEAELTDELDLSDLEDLIDADAKPESALQAEASADELDLEFDVDDESVEPESVDELDLADLDMEAESDAVPEAADEAGAAADELDLEFDVEAESDQPAAETEEAGELDLSDLGDILETDEEPVPVEPLAETSEEMEVDLELDFDADEEAPAPVAEATADSADELDFSDLGKMLEEDEEPVTESKADEIPEDLDLDFEMDLETDTAVPEPAVSGAQPVDDEEEFLDIEKMLEESEEAAVEIEPTMDTPELDTPDFDLDFEDELQEQDVLDISESVEDDLEFNLLESDEAALQEDVAADLEPSELQQASAATDSIGDITDDFDTDEFSDDLDLSGETDIIEGISEPPPHPPKPKRGVGKPVLVFGVLIILLAAVLIIPQNLGLKIPFLSDIDVPYISDIKIPYVYNKFNPEAKDIAGNLKITPLGKSISYQFVDNSQAGTLFVIKGDLKNEYDHPRSYIQVTGKLFLKGNKLSKKATVFGGNLFSEQELVSLEMSAINKRLLNKVGTKKSNFKVKSGGVVPFMVVFDKLPKNLDEYTIEVAGSKL